MNKHTLRIIHICDIHMEADYFYSKSKESTISCNEHNKPHGNISVNRIVSMYDKPSILIVL